MHFNGVNILFQVTTKDSCENVDPIPPVPVVKSEGVNFYITTPFSP